MVTVAKEEKNASPITRSLQIQTTTEKNCVDLISRPTKQEKMLQLQNTYILRKRSQKLKNIYTSIFLLPSIKRLHIMTTILLLKRNPFIYGLISHNVHLGINTPQKHHPIFLLSALLNLQTVQALHFQTIPPIYCFFVTQH